MYTVCPKCTLTLAVTASDLRTGQGYVRCGRCSNVFNALLTLSEQPPELFGLMRAPQSSEVASSAQVERILLSAASAAGTTPGAAKGKVAPDPAASTAASAAGNAGGTAAGAATASKSAAGNASTPAARAALLARNALLQTQSRLANASTRSQPGPAVRTPLEPATSAAAATKSAATAAPPAAAKSSQGAVAGAASMAATSAATTSDAAAQADATTEPATGEDVTDQFELPRRARKQAAPRTPQRAATGAAEEILPQTQADQDELALDTDAAEPRARETADASMVETIVLEGEGFTQTSGYVSEEQTELEALKREIERLGDELPPTSTGTAAHARAPGHSSPGQMRAGDRAGVERRAGTERRAAASAEAGATPSQPAPMQADGRWGSHSEGFEAEEVKLLAELPQQLAEDAAALQFSSPPGQSVRDHWAWLWGAIALAVLLTAQAVNHWRDALAASPSLGGLVTSTYAKLGVALEPHWDLTAYEVRQQGAEADPKDIHVIHVRLSLANHASRAQPVPLLRLTLLDRYGKRLAQRDLEPAEYWPAGRPPAAFMHSDERIDSEVAVRDPHADSASFELDVCLSEHQHIHCAGDLVNTVAAPLAP